MIGGARDRRRAASGGAARRVRWVPAAMALVIGGCGPSGPPDGGAANEIVPELARLSFVPRGRSAPSAGPLQCGAEEDLLVDRFEVTWALFDAHAAGAGVEVPEAFRPAARVRLPAARPTAWAVDTPAVGMTLDEAGRLAAARGMRLPTLEEWLWCATGRYGRRFPSGKNQRGFANTAETGIRSLAPVGAFESGRTPDTELYDLLGNAWEWVAPVPEGRLRRDWAVQNLEAWPRDGWREAPGRCLGGSFARPSRPTFTPDLRLHALAVAEADRSGEVGFRCVAPARAFLRARAGVVVDPGDEEAIRAIGSRWGARAVPLLESLAGELPGSALMGTLLEGARR